MPSYLIDTTVLIDHQRNRREATEFLQRKGLLLAYVSVMEMIAGARNTNMLRENRRITEGFVIDWGGEEINRRAVGLLEKYRAKVGLGMYDSFLAATAMIRKLTLVTDNVKHFRGIAGLEVKTLSQVVE